MPGSQVPSPGRSTVNHELNKAFLFLRTATFAVAILKEQTYATRAYIQYAKIKGNCEGHVRRADELAMEQRDLLKWSERLLEGQVGFADWVACSRIHRHLPAEILEMFRDMLKDS